jgi:RHS repeat-associated protein
MRFTRLALSFFCFFSVSVSLQAQMPPNLENGFKHWGSYDGGSLDTVNNLNGNQMLHAPLLPNYPQRGGKLTMQSFLYQTSKSWQVSCTVGLNEEVTCQWILGRSGVNLRQSEGLTIQRTMHQFGSGTGQISFNAHGYTIQDATGAAHQMTGTGPLDSTGESTKFDSIDTSGYHMEMSNPDSYGVMNTATVTDRHGTQYMVSSWLGGTDTGPTFCPPLPGNHLPAARSGGGLIEPIIDDAPLGQQDCPQAAFAEQITDSNGNSISNPAAGPTDTLGRNFAFFNGGVTTTDYSGCTSSHTISAARMQSYITPDGTTRQVKLCFGNIPISTAFNVSGIVESTGYSSPQLVTAVLADGTKWTFDYDNYGQVTFMGLPTGGSISYTWTTIAFPSCAAPDGGVSRAVASRTVNDNNGHSYIWHYSWGTVVNSIISNTVTDPLNNDTVHVFTALDGTGLGECGFFETRTQSYQGTGGSRQLLQQVDTTYSKAFFNPETAVGTGLGDVVPISIQTAIYPSGKVNLVQKTYAPPTVAGGPISGSVATEKVYDWGQGTPGTLLKEIDTTYQWQGNSSYRTANMLDLPSSVIIRDGSGNRVSETDYSYDEPTYLRVPTPAVTTQHNATPPAGVRGNLTTVSRWLNTTNSFIPSHTYWYDTGEAYQSIDALGHTTTHSYDPAYVGAYATQTCSPQTGAVTHCLSGTYDFNTGVLTSLTNENATAQSSGNTPGDGPHTSNYTYDYMFRIMSAQAPPDPANAGARAQTGLGFSAPNAFPLSVQQTKSVTTSLSDSATNFFDGLGRSYKGQHSLPNGTATVDITFDGLGHPVTVSNPYFTTSDPTYGLTQNVYELGRATQTTKQDGSINSVKYNVAVSAAGDCTETTDEAGKQRRACSDALGRLVEVDEPNSSAVGTSATASVTINGILGRVPNGGSFRLANSNSALATVATSDGFSHVFYIDANQHVNHLSSSDSQAWQTQDLTTITGSVLAASHSGLFGFPNLLGTAQQIFYVGSNQHIYQYYTSGSTWVVQDLTAATGNSLASSSSPLTGFSDSIPGPGTDAHVFYIGANQHIYQLLFNSATWSWSNSDLTAATGNVLAASGSPLSGFSDSIGEHVYYLDTNQHVNQLFTNGSPWSNSDLNAATGTPAAGSLGGLISLDDTLPAMGNTNHVFYLRSNQHVGQLWFDMRSWSWGGQDNSAVANYYALGASGTAMTAIADTLPGMGSAEHLFYIGSDQHLYQMSFGSNSWSWSGTDMSGSTGGTLVSSGSGLASLGDGGSQEHVYYVASDQHVHHLWFKTSSWTWVDQDLTGVTTSTTADAGTVSLTVGAFTATACYGSSSNPACLGQPVNIYPHDVAAALAQTLNVPASPASATVGQSTINLTWKEPGPFTPSVSALSTTHDNAAVFPNASFTSQPTTFANGTGALAAGGVYSTLYTYDALGNLLCVEQHGDATTGTGCSAAASNDATSPWRVRRFTYDSFSRLLTAKNPESGTITYVYDNDGNLLQKTSPAPNQTGSATQTVSYCYDALHRVTGKGYGAQSCPLTTPVVTYAYDSGANAKGHLTSLADQAGTATYGYDILGRLITETRTLTGANNAAIAKTVSYDYNLDGSLKTLHYPSGAAVTYTPDSAGRTLSAVDSGSAINYVTGATYGPDSALTGFISGNSGTFAGITNAFNYNKRLQPQNMSATAPSQTVFSIGYDFHAGNGTAGSGTSNGNVWGITNYKDTTRNQTFTYDPLNRLVSAQNAGTDCNVPVLGSKKKFWGNSYGYDAWGNLLSKAVTKCSSEAFSVVAGNDNRLQGAYTYDAAGNMLHDANSGLNYSWDQENRLTGANGFTYTYDGDGNRARKSNGNLAANGTLYWYMTPGVVAETDLAGTLKSEYVFFDGERVARRDGATGTGGVFYYFSDHLKTASVITDSVGVIKAESDYYPWGGEVQFINNDSNDYKFTGKKRDVETGLDYMGARYYSNALGRFMTTDPAKQHNHPADPRSLNLYSYTLNNPVRFIDPDGKCTAPPVGPGQVGICVEAFIQAKWIGGIGRGDNRGTVANDKNATFKTHDNIVIDPKSHQIVSHQRDAGVSGLLCRSCGFKGTAESSIESKQVDKNGTLTFNLHTTGENAMALAPGAPKGTIEHTIIFKVDKDGSVSIDGGLRKSYPSLEVYAYDDKGNSKQLLFVPEKTPDALNDRPRQDIPPTPPPPPPPEERKNQ